MQAHLFMWVMALAERKPKKMDVLSRTGGEARDTPRLGNEHAGLGLTGSRILNPP